MPILKALYQVIPDKVIAEGSGAVWTVQIQGRRADGVPFTSSMFNYSGGMGARATKEGPSATCFPTGVAAVPVEILEATMPIVFDRRELRPGSGGTGRVRGGDGQIIAFHMRTDEPWTLNAVPSRLSRVRTGSRAAAREPPENSSSTASLSRRRTRSSCGRPTRSGWRRRAAGATVHPRPRRSAPEPRRAIRQ